VRTGPVKARPTRRRHHEYIADATHTHTVAVGPAVPACQSFPRGTPARWRGGAHGGGKHVNHADG
jgi:hypothetical protein